MDHQKPHFSYILTIKIKQNQQEPTKLAKPITHFHHFHQKRVKIITDQQKFMLFWEWPIKERKQKSLKLK